MVFHSCMSFLLLHWSFRKYWLNALCRSSKCLHISLCNIKKEHFLSYHWPHQKYLLVAGSCQVHDGTHKPSTILIFTLEVHILSLATYTASCFPRSDRLTLFAFENMSAKYPSLNNHHVSVGCSFYVKKKMAFGENRQFQLITRMLTREPLLQQTSYLSYNVRAYTNTSLSVFLQELIKLVIFTASSRTFQDEAGIFYCPHVVMRNTMMTGTIWCHSLDSC